MATSAYKALLCESATIGTTTAVAVDLAAHRGGGSVKYSGYRPDTQSQLKAYSDGLALLVVELLAFLV